MREVFGSKKG